MTKVAEIIRFYSLDEILEFIEKGGEYPLHHIWCYDKIIESGFSVDCIEYDRESLLNRFGKKLQIRNFQQQINLLKNSKEYDLIFVPFLADVFLLALLKLIGLYKKPIFGLALDAHVPFKKNILKKLKQKIERYITFNGVDSILFFNEKIYQKSNEYSVLSNNHCYTDTWGTDLDFFDLFIENQTEPPTRDFIYSTGGSGRDYKTLIEAFNEIDFNLKITTKTNMDKNLKEGVTPNVLIDNSIKPGLYSVGLMRKEYYNSLAVAIPLCNTGRHWPVGITVILEALAMGKPIISTYNPMHPFNFEKEKVGFHVDFDDVNGWRQCVNYMIDNPDEAREMGERGRYLCERKYNYKLFSKEVISQIQKMSIKQTEIKLQEEKVSN